MNARILTGAAALALVLGTSGAYAQNAMSGEAPLKEWTKAEVPPDKPFGDIEVNTAMSGEGQIPTFFKSLSAEQAAELRGRCGVIEQNASDYDQQAVTWCKLFVQAAQTTPVQ